MVLSIGLIISLGTTLLLCGLIFIFFRRRIQVIDNKINQTLGTIQEITHLFHNSNRMKDNGNENTNEIIQSNNEFSFFPTDNQQKLVKVSDNEDDDEDDDDNSESDNENESDDDDDNSESHEDSENEDEDMNNTNIIEDEINNLKQNQINEDHELTIEEIDNSSNIQQDNEENEKHIIYTEENDFRKLNVAKLRKIVEEKNLHDDPKKLKKQELITLLEN